MLKSLHPTLVSLCFLFAYLSYYLNFYGLLSPCALSSFATTLPFLRPIFFPLLTFTYRHLINEANSSGSPFYSFQWDSLLIEAGTVVSIQSISHLVLGDKLENVTKHLTRLLLFKLMFMSGVVKIQSACPTWLQLTALEYHYATQPLPSSLAYTVLNRLNPFLHRLSVALTFLFEVPASVLLLGPTIPVRQLGAKIQVLLQILIASTGSYTFFNLLTAALAVGVYESDSDFPVPFALPSFVQTLLCHSYLAFCAGEMFSIGSLTPDKASIELSEVDVSVLETVGLNLKMGPKMTNDLITSLLPPVIFASFCYIIVNGVKNVLLPFPNSFPSLLKSGWHAIFLSITVYVGCGQMLPMYTLTPSLRERHINNPTDVLSKASMHSYTNAVGKFGLASGYGLFRSMTGVGWEEESANKNKKDYGWAGLPPSVVSRPEIVLEGLFEFEDGDRWEELDFKWKPGKLDREPGYPAPYQPRLDWQMWFAALGGYQQNVWFISLVDKLLENCKSVVNLMDVSVELKAKMNDGKMKMVKATKYQYDFTRVRNKWNQKIPNVVFAEDSQEEFKRNPKYDWWYRKGGEEYIPALEKGNESVKKSLESFGLDKACNEGDGIEEGTLDNWLLKLRDNNGIWSPVIFVFFASAIGLLDNMNLVPKKWLRSRRAHKWTAGRTKDKEE